MNSASTLNGAMNLNFFSDGINYSDATRTMMAVQAVCAFTSDDGIMNGTSYSNDTFTLTLDDQNASNSTVTIYL